MKRLLLIAVLFSACTKPAADSSVGVVNDVMAALETRFERLTDVHYRGDAVGKAGEKIAFSFWRKWPNQMRVDVANNQTSFIFDGQVLGIIDHKEKRLLKQDLKGHSAADVASALQEVFGDYVNGGYKMPLLRVGDPSFRGTSTRDGKKGAQWVVTSALDDGKITKVEYQFSQPRADFVHKTIFDVDGKLVAKVEVVEQHRDKKTGYDFPKKWQIERLGNGFTIELDEIHINEGLAKDTFSLALPAGYDFKEFQR